MVTGLQLLLSINRNIKRTLRLIFQEATERQERNITIHHNSNLLPPKASLCYHLARGHPVNDEDLRSLLIWCQQ